DGVKSKLENAVIVLAGVEGDKVSLIASVAKDFTASIKAGDIIKHLATELGGKGGGKPDLAQGGAPPCAKSGLPPPLPPSSVARCLMMSPAFIDAVKSFAT